jgi:hypothetical protein
VGNRPGDCRQRSGKPWVTVELSNYRATFFPKSLKEKRRKGEEQNSKTKKRPPVLPFLLFKTLILCCEL